MSSLSTNNRTLTGIITYDDGAGGILEGGILTSDHINSSSSEMKNIDVDSLLIQNELLVNNITITPIWLSYLYGLTGNIQSQINGVASTILASVNTWTKSQTFSGNVVNLIFRNTSTLFPTRSSTYIGAIYGWVSNPYAMTFMNSNSNLTTSNGAFCFEKMIDSSSTVQLMEIRNNGAVEILGAIQSPTITSINSSISTCNTNIATNTTNIATNTANIVTCNTNIATNTANIAAKQDIVSTSNRLSATFIGDGLPEISDGEFGTLGGVTSAIQSQLNNKQDLISGTNLLDAAYIGTGIISNTEFNYLNGVTSDIQTQIDMKQPYISASNRLDAAYISTGVISNTEFNYLDGTSSNIQTQLNSINTTLTNNLSSFDSNVINYNYRQGGTGRNSVSKTYTWSTLPEYIISTAGGITITLPNASIAGHLGATCYIYNDGNYNTTVNVTGQDIREGVPSPADKTSFIFGPGLTRQFFVQNFIWTVANY